MPTARKTPKPQSDYSGRIAFTVDEWCRDVFPESRAAAYQDMAAGLLMFFERGARRYIPASEREAYPARLAARIAERDGEQAA